MTTYRFCGFCLVFTVAAAFPSWAAPAAGAEPAISSRTEECLLCHEILNPGLVADWRTSRHSRLTPAAALENPPIQRRLSAESVPEPLRNVVVGCYECHSLNADQHRDNFQHEGVAINVIVTPNDCRTCHPVEAAQYAESKKAHAYGNLKKNPLYHQMVQTVTGLPELHDGRLAHLANAPTPNEDTCLSCHGTVIEVRGRKTITLDEGEQIEVPDLVNWPNHGVGRVNPDGSLGACTACHPRHSFSLEVARKPFTCAQCHLAPDTPAWEVYRESKHGNLMLSLGDKWNWDAVPWVPGRDFTAPTCATCHNSLLADADGNELVPRTHDFGARLWVRLFGLPYAHPQPKHGATHVIRNADDQPLPTAFDGEPASDFLISADEQTARRELMRRVCVNCHGTDFANQHFARLDRVVKESNDMTRLATDLLKRAWENGQADPANPFDELVEMKWVQHWLFYATSVRYAAAMGGPDYAAFKNGWWDLHRNLRELEALLQKQPGEATR